MQIDKEKAQTMARADRLFEKKKVICIGGANVDRKALSNHEIQFHTSNPVSITQSCGGVARNVAENLARLGTSVSLMTFVGDDQEGRWVLEQTKAHGVDIRPSYVLPQRRTGTYTAVIDSKGEMLLALADMHIYEELDKHFLDLKWSYLVGSDVVFVDTNVSSEFLHTLIERSRTEKWSLCINAVSAFKAKKLPSDLRGVDLLILNGDEAEAILNQPISKVNDISRVCEQLLQFGVQRIVLTLGDEGVIWKDQTKEGRLYPQKVEVIDVTGAGDSLVSGVLFGLIQGELLEKACQIGMTCASLTLQTSQTVASLTIDQVYAMTKEEQ